MRDYANVYVLGMEEQKKITFDNARWETLKFHFFCFYFSIIKHSEDGMDSKHKKYICASSPHRISYKYYAQIILSVLPSKQKSKKAL